MFCSELKSFEDFSDFIDNDPNFKNGFKIRQDLIHYFVWRKEDGNYRVIQYIEDLKIEYEITMDILYRYIKNEAEKFAWFNKEENIEENYIHLDMLKVNVYKLLTSQCDLIGELI